MKAVLSYLPFAAAGTETQSLSSPLKALEGRKERKRKERGGRAFWNQWGLWCWYPCHRPVLSWTASIFGHDHKLISCTFDW